MNGVGWEPSLAEQTQMLKIARANAERLKNGKQKAIRTAELLERYKASGCKTIEEFQAYLNRSE